MKNLLTATSYRRDKREETTNGNKKMYCDRCMRSDILKRHANTHKDIPTKKPAKNYKDAVQMQPEERRQGLMEIAQQENIPISLCNDVIQSPTSTLDTTNLEGELLQDNRDYLDNIELGKKIIPLSIKE